VTAALALYRLATRLLEPAVPMLMRQRVKRGKERADRVGERLGHTSARRPSGLLLWLHGASVGESRLLIDLVAELRRRRPQLSALVTTQTLTSADMIASWAPPGIVHQMAPVDTIKTVDRFLDAWRPDAAVFAEGEIWPNMLAGLRKRAIPAALVNARMTTKSLDRWRRRRPSAQQIFSTFTFIGAADEATALGLGEILRKPIGAVGNLKRAAAINPPPAHLVSYWRDAAGGRPILLAASTHPGEEEMALQAFAEVRSRFPAALLIIAPRHPERGASIADVASRHGLTPQLRSRTRSTPEAAISVLVADTIGELLFWYAAADGVYLGGATAPGVGGHNAIEPAALGKCVFTGPNGFNFRETFDTLEALDAIVIGDTAGELARHWLDAISSPPSQQAIRLALEPFFREASAPFDTTVEAILALLPASAGGDTAHA